MSRARFCQSELIYVTSLEVSTTLKDCIEGPAGGLGSRMPSVAKLCTNMWKLGVDTKSIQIYRGCHGCQWLSPVVNMLSLLLLYVFVLLGGIILSHILHLPSIRGPCLALEADAMAAKAEAAKSEVRWPPSMEGCSQSSRSKWSNGNGWH